MLSPALPVSRFPTSFRPRSQIAWTAWVVFLAVVIGSVLLAKRQGVYPIFGQAGRSWWRGESLYQRHGGLDQYLYAPGVAPLFVVLGRLPDPLAGVLWRLGGVALVGVAMARYLRMLGPSIGLSRLCPAALWLLVLPLLGASIHNGQTNILLLGLMLTAMVAVRRERWWLAAFALGLAGLFKVYPLFLALLVGLAFPRPFWWRLMVVLAAGMLAPFLLQHPSYVWAQYQDWFHVLATQDRSMWTLERAPRDLYLLTRLTGDPLAVPLYRVVQGALTLLVLGVCWQARKMHGPGPLLCHRLFTLGCCWMLILGPAAESSTYCLLAPALALALLTSEGNGERRMLLWLLYALLVVSALLCWFPSGKYWATILQPMAGLAFFIERLGWALRRPTSRRPAWPRIWRARVALIEEKRTCSGRSS